MVGVSKKGRPWTIHLWEAAMGPPGLCQAYLGVILVGPGWQPLPLVELLAVSRTGVC